MLYEKWMSSQMSDSIGLYSVKHFHCWHSLQTSHEPSYMVIQAPIMLNGMGKEGQKKTRQNN